MRNILVAGAVAALLAACASDDGTEAAPTVTETVFVTVEPEPAADTQPEREETGMQPGDESWLGSFEEPLPTGEAITLAAWGVTFQPAETRPTDIEPGHVLLVAEVEAFRTADTAGAVYSFEAGLNFTVVGASGVELESPCLVDGDLDVTAEVQPGAAVSGLICHIIPEGELDGAVWRIHQQGMDAPAYVATS